MGTFKPDGTLNHHMMHCSADYPYKIPFSPQQPPCDSGHAVATLRDRGAQRREISGCCFFVHRRGRRARSRRSTDGADNAHCARNTHARRLFSRVYPAVNARYGVSLRARRRSYSGRHGALPLIAPRYAPGPGCIAPWLREARKGKAEEEGRGKGDVVVVIRCFRHLRILRARCDRASFSGLATFSTLAGQATCLAAARGAGVAVVKGYGPTVRRPSGRARRRTCLARISRRVISLCYREDTARARSKSTRTGTIGIVCPGSLRHTEIRDCVRQSPT